MSFCENDVYHNDEYTLTVVKVYSV